MISNKKFTFNPFLENTFILYNQKGAGLVIDPGMQTPEEENIFLSFLSEEKITIEKILITHAHMDHLAGIPSIQKHFPEVKLYVPELDKPLLENKEPSIYPTLNTYTVPVPTEWIRGGEEITLGEIALQCLSLPGHTPGHVVFYNEEQSWLFSGDTLFKHTIGRTDLPFANEKELIQNIKNVILPLPNEVHVYPGHGEETTVGEEKKENPFLK